MTTLAFAFTKLVVTDLARETAFYRDAIGLHPVGHACTDEHEEAILAIPGQQGSPLLMLMRYLDRPAPPADSACVGFAVNDLPTTIAAVEAGGGRVVTPPQDVAEHRLTIAIVADPEGHPVELTAKMH